MLQPQNPHSATSGPLLIYRQRSEADGNTCQVEGLGDKVEELSQESTTARQIDENKERKVNWRTNTGDPICIKGIAKIIK